MRAGIVLVALALACGKPPAKPAGSARAAPALFAHVPADTPFFAGAFEAVPLGYWDKVKRAAAPVFFRALRYLGTVDETGVLVNVAAAIDAELGGELTAESLARVGLSATPRYAIYAVDLTTFVARVEIADDARLLATVERVARRTKLPLPAPAQRGGRTYWRIAVPPDAGEPAAAGVAVVIALADDQLVLAAGKSADVDRHLAAILGLEKPRASMADGAALAQLAQRHALGPHVLGFIDSRRMAQAVIRLSGTAVTATCTREIERLAGRVPRLVFGWFVHERATGGGAVLELAPDLATELAALQTEVAGLDVVVSDGPQITMGAGLDLDRARLVGLAAIRALQHATVTCGSPPDDDLARAEAFLASPLPAPWSGLRGMLLAIHDIAFPPGGGMPTRLDVTLAATGAAPAAVLDAIEQLGLPAIPRDGTLHPLAPLPLPFPVQAGVGPHAIVVATGPQSAALGAQVLAARPRGRAPLFVVNYDAEAWERLQTEVDRADADDDEDADGPLPAELEQQLHEAHGKLYGRTRGKATVDSAGLTMTWSTELR